MSKQSKRHMGLEVQGDLVTSNSLMFRNRIINGDCSVAQRGAVAAVNNAVNYGGADRIFVAPINFTTASGTITRSDLAEGVAGYGQFLTSFNTTGSGSVVFGQRIESVNTRDLNSKTVTFSGIVYQNTGSSVTVNIKVQKANSTDNFATSTQIGSTGVVTVPSGVSTTFSLTVTLGNTDGNNGLLGEIIFTGLGALSSRVFGVSNLQLEAGSSASAFEHRPYGMELSLCQRYYEVIVDYVTAASKGLDANYDGHVLFSGPRFAVEKRHPITQNDVTISDSAGWLANETNWRTTSYTRAFSHFWTISTTTHLVLSGTWGWVDNNATSAHQNTIAIKGTFKIDAEL